MPRGITAPEAVDVGEAIISSNYKIPFLDIGRFANQVNINPQSTQSFINSGLLLDTSKQALIIQSNSMSDFVGSYYSSSDLAEPDNAQFDSLFVEVPVSIVDMDRLDKRSPASCRMRQLDSLSTRCDFTETDHNETAVKYKGFSKNVPQNDVDIPARKSEDDDDDLDMPVASMTFLDGSSPSLATVPLSVVRSMRPLHALSGGKSEQSLNPSIHVRGKLFKASSNDHGRAPDEAGCGSQIVSVVASSSPNRSVQSPTSTDQALVCEKSFDQNGELEPENPDLAKRPIPVPSGSKDRISVIARVRQSFLRFFIRQDSNTKE